MPTGIDTVDSDLRASYPVEALTGIHTVDSDSLGG